MSKAGLRKPDGCNRPCNVRELKHFIEKAVILGMRPATPCYRMKKLGIEI